MLGLDPASRLTTKQVRGAFLQMALQHHPDKNIPKDRRAKTELFQSIQRSYDALLAHLSAGVTKPSTESTPTAQPDASAEPSTVRPWPDPADSEEIRAAKLQLKRKGCELLLDSALLTASEEKRRKLVNGLSQPVAHALARELQSQLAWVSQFPPSGAFPLSLARFSSSGVLERGCYEALIDVFSSKKKQWMPGQAGKSLGSKSPAGLWYFRGNGWRVSQNRGRTLQQLEFHVSRWKSWELCFRMAELQLAVLVSQAAPPKNLRERRRLARLHSDKATAQIQKVEYMHVERRTGVASVAGQQRGMAWRYSTSMRGKNPALMTVAHMLSVGLKHAMTSDGREAVVQRQKFESDAFGGWPLPFSWRLRKLSKSRGKNDNFQTEYFPCQEMAVEAQEISGPHFIKGLNQSAKKNALQAISKLQDNAGFSLANKQRLLRMLHAHAGQPAVQWRIVGKSPTQFLEIPPSQRTSLKPVPPSPGPSVGTSSALHMQPEVSVVRQIVPFLAETMPLCTRLELLQAQRENRQLSLQQHSVAVQRTLGESVTRLQVPAFAQRQFRTQGIPAHEWHEMWLATVHHGAVQDACFQAVADICVRRAANLPLISTEMAKPSSEPQEKVGRRRRTKGLFQ